MFPYVRSIVWPVNPHQRTTPNRVSYFIWWTLSVINFFAYRAAGEKETLLLPLIGCFTSGTILLLSLKWGERKWYPVDKYCLGLGILAISFWWITESPLAAICIIVIADALAVVPTISKICRNPWSENITGWTCGFCASIANTFAIKELTWANGVYNGYMVLSFSSVLIALFYGHRTNKIQNTPPM